MRITGGRARGIQLKAPKGDVARPATDRMREAVFSSLGTLVEGSQIVDFFAGTGSYGLEAISRGAVRATFYETNRDALACLKQNQKAVLKACSLENGVVSTLARSVYTMETVSEKADLIFVDPPYGVIEDQFEKIFQKVNQHATEDASVIFELPGNLELETEGWQIVSRFGKPKRDTPNAVIFERRTPETPNVEH